MFPSICRKLRPLKLITLERAQEFHKSGSHQELKEQVEKARSLPEGADVGSSAAQQIAAKIQTAETTCVVS